MDPVAKATKGKARTAQDRGGPNKPAAVAIQERGPGRPKIDGPRPWEIEGVSKRSWYRKRSGK
jgi:hypothetical protein